MNMKEFVDNIREAAKAGLVTLVKMTDSDLKKGCKIRFRIESKHWPARA